ncbi:MAG: Ppx/GppA family phosphatase [Propionibacteriaceae bacterium]|jgi:exopolyphosphatase/guanosine-5'-triphosphate,3'-diphosphate pyrophosphatase|nr:Ppx/GppA family phosphatase [Propionibacteriaceae bacterium]
MRVAIIDCGTNTLRLLVADGTADGLTEVTRQVRFARLGQGVDATGSFHPDALERTFSIVSEYTQNIHDLNVDQVRFVATSAARDAKNREDFYQGVHARLGILPQIISGEEEAELSFLGALAGGPTSDGDALVIDIGGGSTELIRGSTAGVIESSVSLDMGSVRIRERYLLTDPPQPDHIAQASEFVANLLDNCAVPLGGIETFIGVAGTVTSLSGMHQELPAYDRARVHNSTLELTTVAELSQRLLTMTVAETIALYPSLQVERAEVICAGSLIAAEIAQRVGRPMVVRETDILDGAAMKLMVAQP